MRINPKYKVRSVAGVNLVVLQGNVNADMTSVIDLNSTAVELWNEFAGKDFTAEDVAAYLIGKYGIDDALAATDASKWIDALKGCDIIS